MEKEPLYNSLNDSQKEAVTMTNRHLRIVAGAGSGKTRVLMARIEYLIREMNVFPSRILAITFTNKATREMQERLEAQLGPEADKVRISTIHSLCVRILREDAHEIDYPSNFTILDGDDQRSILTSFYKDLGIDRKTYAPSQMLSFISKWKFNKISPEEAKDSAILKNEQIAATLYPLYQSKLLDLKAMDFDDLLLNAHDLLEQKEHVRAKWQRRIDYLHVDEFQDVDPIQYAIIKNLTGENARLCVVGDPDQTIYTWRGASVNIILDYDKDFKPCHTVLLTENYRSTSSILNAANALISNNRIRIKKDLYTNSQEGQPIIIEENDDDESEANYVVSRIYNDHRISKTPYNNIAILYRSNFSSRAFEKSLKNKGIPYQVYGGIRFYERKEIKDLLAYLRLAMDPKDDEEFKRTLDLSILRIINEPKRKIGNKTISALIQESEQRNIPLIDVLADPQTIKGATRKKVTDFYGLIETFRHALRDFPIEDVIDVILEESGYRKMLEDLNENERLENLQELKKDFKNFTGLNQDILEEYFQDVSLYTDRSNDQQGNGVTLMTIHSAKGTEFDNIYLVNVNEGIFPTRRAVESANVAQTLEEERRLFYVAMTRAKKELTISWNRGYSFATGTGKIPSRFIKEIPREFTNKKNSPIKPENTGFDEFDLPAPKTRTKARKFKRGDLIQHDTFGEGIVISIEDYMMKVAFQHGIGIKTLNMNHSSIHKI